MACHNVVQNISNTTFRYIARSKTVGSHGSSIFFFFKKCHIVFHQCLHQFIFASTVLCVCLISILESSLHSHVHFSIIYNCRDMETTCVLWWMSQKNKMWYIYTMDYYSVIKRRNVPFSATRMNLEGILQVKWAGKRKTITVWHQVRVESFF